VTTLTRTAWCVAALIALTMWRPASTDAQRESKPAFSDVQVDSVQIADVDSEGVQATIRLSAKANVSATLESLVFDRATINAMRINLPPVRGPIRLREGEAIDGLPPLRARLSFRELESLQPIRRVVEEEKARFQATLRGRLSLNIFQQLALLSRGAWVVSRVDHEVPVELTGGAFTRMAALGALTIAEPIWAASRPERARASAMADSAAAAVNRSMVSLETRYDVVSRGGEAARMSHLSAGFLVDGTQVLVPAEAIEPWLFDEALAEAIGQGDVSVRTASIDVLMTPLAAGTAGGGLSLQRKQLRLVKLLSGSENAISVKTKRPYRVRFRAADSNAALLAVSGWSGSGLTATDPAPPAAWQPAVIAMLRRGSGAVETEFRQTSIRWDEGRYQIRDPVDADAFGSPIWTEAGVVGLVQDESSGAAVKKVLEMLR